jgi:Spy/CpxP family protein refolding chaperone
VRIFVDNRRAMLSESKEVTMKSPFILGLTAAATIALSLAAFTAGDLAFGTMTPVSAQSAPGDQGGQGGPGGGGKHGNQAFAKMLLSLNLSDGQKSQIRAMMTDARAKMKTLTDQQAKRDTMKAAFAKIETVLTPAQATKLKEERAAFFKAHPPSNPNHS